MGKIPREKENLESLLRIRGSKEKKMTPFM